MLVPGHHTVVQHHETAAAFVRGKIREIVRDPKLAEALSPQYVIGCKRLCVDTNYYETYNRPNVTLVDVKESAIRRITRTGIELENGQHYEVDLIIFALGFPMLALFKLVTDVGDALYAAALAA